MLEHLRHLVTGGVLIAFIALQSCGTDEPADGAAPSQAVKPCKVLRKIPKAHPSESRVGARWSSYAASVRGLTVGDRLTPSQKGSTDALATAADSVAALTPLSPDRAVDDADREFQRAIRGLEISCELTYSTFEVEKPEVTPPPDITG